MKNKKHSELINKLCQLRREYKGYNASIILNKNDISVRFLDMYSEQPLISIIANLEEDRYAINQIQKEIKKTKQQIYFVQKEYSLNHANQQPSQPLKKLEGSETNSWN